MKRKGSWELGAGVVMGVQSARGVSKELEDRVFAHALQTVKKIPRTGSIRPPPEDRLRLYGLYKQSMEGDVTGVMERPEGRGEEVKAEQEKWRGRDARGKRVLIGIYGAHRRGGRDRDAWNAQKGVAKTEAKRRYITTLIETMHKYAYATLEARELVSELEFVWDQIKSNVPSNASTNSPPLPNTGADLHPFHSQTTPNNPNTPYYPPVTPSSAALGVIPPNPFGEEEQETFSEDADFCRDPARSNKRWRHRVETALVMMTAEIAALREQLENRRVARKRGRVGRLGKWVLCVLWVVVKHVVVETVFWGAVFLWMKRRGDGRAQDAMRLVIGFVKQGLREMGFARRRRAPAPADMARLLSE
ncbi:hypothetical protein RUND412_001888 [Rhizina undulata]